MMGDLSVEGLTAGYRIGREEVRVLDGFDLSAPAGTTHLLVGPSGSGKTTLLSCLAGILTPMEGTIRLGEMVLDELGPKQRLAYRRRTVGIAFQSFNLVPSLTAHQNVMAPLLSNGESLRAARARAAECLERVGLDRHLRRLPSEMSGGEQQRVAIARAVVHDPPLLVADEPTAHLDHVQVEAIVELLRDLASPDRVVLIATHDPRLLTLTDDLIDLGAAHGVPFRR